MLERCKESFCLFMSWLISILEVVSAKHACTGTGHNIYYCEDTYRCCVGGYSCCNYEKTSTDSLSASAIAGIVVGGLAGLLVICVGGGVLMSSICKAFTKRKRLIEPRTAQTREANEISSCQMNEQPPSYEQSVYGQPPSYEQLA